MCQGALYKPSGFFKYKLRECIRLAQYDQRVLFTEDQAFYPSYDLAPLPPPPTSSSPVSKLDRRHTGRLRKRDNLLTRSGGQGRSQIIRRQERLILFKTCHTSQVRQSSQIVTYTYSSACMLASCKTIFGMFHVTMPLKKCLEQKLEACNCCPSENCALCMQPITQRVRMKSCAEQPFRRNKQSPPGQRSFKSCRIYVPGEHETVL